jgi:hypothetical protein
VTWKKLEVGIFEEKSIHLLMETQVHISILSMDHVSKYNFVLICKLRVMCSCIWQLLALIAISFDVVNVKSRLLQITTSYYKFLIHVHILHEL